jgi:predicted porin
MKTISFAMFAVMAATAHAQADSNLTIYGGLDMALTHVDNIKGKSKTSADSGGFYGSRLGFRGTEDLGDGMKAVFTIETGIRADDGTSAPTGLAWGRQSFVGLTHPTLGSFTLGRQYDFTYVGSGVPLDVGALLIGNLAGATGGAGTSVDNHAGGTRYDNSFKWQKSFGSVSAGLMYGLGKEDGDSKMWSGMMAYRSGPIWAGVGYVHDNFSAPANGNDVVNIGLNYDLMPGHKIVLTHTRSKADVAADRTSSNAMVQFAWLYQVSAPWMVGVMLGDSSLKTGSGQDGSVRQLALAAHYDLSKRTRLYGIWSNVNSGGAAGNAFSGIPALGVPPASLASSTTKQNVLRIGMVHKF